MKYLSDFEAYLAFAVCMGIPIVLFTFILPHGIDKRAESIEEAATAYLKIIFFMSVIIGLSAFFIYSGLRRA